MTTAQPTDPDEEAHSGPRSVPEQREAQAASRLVGIKGVAPKETVCTPAASGKRRLRTVLLLTLSVAVALCIGGVGVAYVVYDKATEPNRSSPVAVVDKYLEGTFIDRNDRRASLYTCGDPRQIREMQSLRSDIENREKRFNVRVTVSWENLAASTSGRTSRVTGDLRLSTSVEGVSQRDVAQWEFRAEDHSGWRVCDGHRIG